MSTQAPEIKEPASAPAATVRTPNYALAQAIAAKALSQRKQAGFFGPPGTGKTVATSDFCKSASVPTLYITAQVAPQRKELYEEVLWLTTGAIPDLTTRALRRECEEVMREQPRIMVIDECQFLRSTWLQQLRSLHDAADFCLLLVGATNAVRIIKADDALWTRVKLRMEFSTLAGDVLINVLHQLHPVLANTERALLEEIDRRDCGGSLRNWGAVLDLALPLLSRSPAPDRLSKPVIRAVFSLRGLR